MINLLLIAVGFVLIIKGADMLVDNSSLLAKKFNIPEIVIGLTIVAFGTSAPELAVNILASINGNTEIAIANILGSNIANILLILGISAIIYPLSVKKETVWKEIPLSLLAAILVGFMANDALIDGMSFSSLTRIDGFILLSFFIIFLYYIVSLSQSGNGDELEEIVNAKDKSVFVLLVLIVIGLVGLIIGGKLVVDSSVAVALAWGVSQSLIGLTIVAIGTSLPELFTSVVAAYKKKPDIAIGNVVGSNIFNIFWILGLSSVINPLPFPSASNVDILMTMIASALLFLFMFIGKKHLLEKWQGVLFLIVYFIYIYTIVIRG